MCREFNQPLYQAFIDLRKAYDSINRDALWIVLRKYAVSEKLVELLQDLHTGTQAAVRLGGQRGKWFEINCGVRQGCVIAPLLFNIFMDCVLKQALAEMPEGCGIRLSYRANGVELLHSKPGCGDSYPVLAALLYADDMSLFSTSKAELELMLQIVDRICDKMCMSINASKTEIMAIEPPFTVSTAATHEGVQLLNGTAAYVDSFKYLGGMINIHADCEQEVSARIAKATGCFARLNRVWDSSSMSLQLKVVLYTTCVRSVLLFSVDTLPLTVSQECRLERMQNKCLRRILHIRISDRHSMADIRLRCGVISIMQQLKAERLRLFGHVLRMDEGRIPHIALHSTIAGVCKRPAGRPRTRWLDCVKRDLQSLGLPIAMDSLRELCSNRSAWRKRLRAITHPSSDGFPSGLNWPAMRQAPVTAASAARQQQQLHAQHADVHVPFAFQMLAGLGFICPNCGGIHPTPQCTRSLVSLYAE